MHFYELHEGDDAIYSDLLLIRDDSMEPDEFFELVQQIRREVQAAFEHDTLIEAIAEVLERDHGFITILDDRLTAAVNVSRDDDDNFLTELEPEEDEFVDDGEFRTVYAEVDPDGSLN